MNDTPEQPTTPLPDSTPQPTPADAQPTTPLQPMAPQQPIGQQSVQSASSAPGYAAAPPGAVPPQQQPAGYPGAAPQQAPTNTLAIIAFVGSFFVSLVGIICGHIALGQIKKTGERGRGFALAGTIIGYVALVGTILAIIFSLFIIGTTASTVKQISDISSDQIEQELEDLESSLPDETDVPADETTDSGTDTDTGTDEATGSGDRSAEFCAAFIELSQLDPTASSGTEIDQATLDAFKKLAELPSPNQDVYQRFYDYIQDPLGSTDTESLMSDYVDAAFDDGMACA
ncbi:MAG: DUF4190 domain-containing protein [Leucobacter sp.]